MPPSGGHRLAGALCRSTTASAGCPRAYHSRSSGGRGRGPPEPLPQPVEAGSCLSKAVGAAWEQAVALEAAECAGGVRATAPSGRGSTAAQPASQGILHFYVPHCSRTRQRFACASGPRQGGQPVSLRSGAVCGQAGVLGWVRLLLPDRHVQRLPAAVDEQQRRAVARFPQRVPHVRGVPHGLPVHFLDDVARL
jgi:hypothetical protein